MLGKKERADRQMMNEKKATGIASYGIVSKAAMSEEAVAKSGSCIWSCWQLQYEMAMAGLRRGLRMQPEDS